MSKSTLSIQEEPKIQYIHYKTKRGEEIKVSIQVITPEKAKQILSQGTAYNRNLSDTHAQKLATKMSNGIWKFNGVPIVINKGSVLDGQHRLQAIILSGQEQECLIVEGIDTEAFLTFDVGKKRDFATMLDIKGEANPYDLAQSVNWMFYHTVGQAKVEIEDKMEMLDAHPTLREAVTKFIDSKRTLKGVAVGFLASTFYLTSKLDADLAGEFFFQVVMGENMTPNTAKLRTTIAEIQEKNLDDKRFYINSAFRQIWNASRAGKTLESVKMSLNIPEFK
jgi:hypothetical protein